MTTFLLTDVQASTRMWADAPEDAAAAFDRLEEMTAATVASHGGRLVRSRGEGDSSFCEFTDAAAALRTALDLQLAIQRELWPPGAPIRLRMAVHTGDADYVSAALCSRLRDAATGGQILVSRASVDEVGAGLPAGTELAELGSVRLRDIDGEVEVLSLSHDELPAARTAVTGSGVLHNLPAPATSFIGRDRTLRQVTKLLEEHRLVTITGPGGVGKTRTALRVAADVADGFTAVRLLELAAVGADDLVAASAAAALGAESDPDPLEAVIEQLRTRSVLVVLDNCEHVVNGAARLAAGLLASCPEVRMLATSRAPMSIAGEQRVPLGPLEVPEADATVEEAATTEAFRLFVDRATAVRPELSVDHDNAADVARICRRLDGIPLAIELTAARVNVLAPGQIAERLDDRLSVVASGPRLGVDRHRTLDELVAWSYELLDPGERAVLERLAVFEGGCTIDAAEVVCTTVPVSQVLDAVSALVDHSLLVAEGGKRVRYRMLETVRAFAATRLAMTDLVEAEEARLGWCVAFAEAYDASVTSDEPGELDEVAAELPNLRAALRFAEGHPGHASTGLAVAADLLDFWQNRAIAEGAEHAERLLALHPERDVLRVRGLYVHGVLHDVRDLQVADASQSEALEIASELGDEVWRARLLTTLSVLARLRGELDLAESRAREAVEMLEARSDESWHAQAAEVLARVMESRGRFKEARDLHRRALIVWERLGETGRTRYPLLNLGAVHQITGELDEARTALSRAAEISRERGDRKTLVVATTNLGRVALAEGETDAARRMFEESLAVATELGSTYDIAYARAFLGNHGRQVGDLGRARFHYERALEAFERNGNAPDAGFIRVMLGRVSLAEGDVAAARAAGTAELRAAVERGDDHSTCEFLEMLALVAAAEGDADRAAMLFGRVEAAREELGVPRELVDEGDFQRWTTVVEQALDERDLEDARRAGRELDLAVAVELASGGRPAQEPGRGL